MKQSCRLVTFGCKVNQVDTQVERERLADEGYIEAVEGETADLYVVNTCTVTENADREALRAVRKLRRDHPSARIVVTGCAAVSGRAMFARITDIAVVERPQRFALKPISAFHGHTRAFLKIQDGCDLRCSFCIIPSVRGGSVSRPLDDVVAEARQLVANGYREIVLTGVHLGGYGKDRDPRMSVADVVRPLLAIPGLGRVRLSSIEANEIGDDLVDIMKTDPRLCPHLHVPLQSGENEILKAMRRRSNAGQYLRRIEKVRAAVPGVALTTDVIVGFPGETEEHFRRTLDVCRSAGFSRIHIFPYSPRRGTTAATTMADSVPKAEKKRRLKELEAVAAAMASDYYGRFVGRTVRLLVERTDDGFHGYDEHYIPCAVRDGKGIAKGELVDVRIASSDGKGMYGDVTIGQ